jgi:hypothetical protein
MIYSALTRLFPAPDERYLSGELIASLRVAFNPCNPQSKGNCYVAAASALAAIAAFGTAKRGFKALPIALAGAAVYFLVIRKIWMTLWPHRFWAYDEMERIANFAQCTSETLYRESTQLAVLSNYFGATFIQKGDSKNNSEAWCKNHGEKLYQISPPLFELVTGQVPNPSALGSQFGFISSMSRSTWKLFCYIEILRQEIEANGCTVEKGEALLTISHIVTEITFRDLTHIHDGDLKRMGAKLASQKSPHFVYIYAFSQSYQLLRAKYKDDFFQEGHRYNAWRLKFNAICDEVDPLWLQTDDSRYKPWFTKDEDPTKNPF